MHRAYSLILAVLLIVALAVPAFASSGDLEYNGLLFPPLPSEADTKLLIYYQPSDGYYYLSSSSIECYIATNGDLRVRQSGLLTSYRNKEGWTSAGSINRNHLPDYPPYKKAGSFELVWANYDIMQENSDGTTSLFMAGSEPVVPPVTCDGTSCSATDIDYNNICDDCGGVLTMSLRSTAYDRAMYLTTTLTSHSYWALFQQGEHYRLYISKSPMTSPDGVTLQGEDLKYMHVYEKADGTIASDGWFTGFDVNYAFEEANHTIENFTAPPLAMVIQGVTGEAMKEKLPNLHQTMKILALCGVGCLALLIGLKLFGKRSLLHLKK